MFPSVFSIDFCTMLNQTEEQVYIVPTSQKQMTMEDKLNQILVYSLLSSKNVLTLADTALLTGLSKSHLYRLTCNHEIPHYKRAKMLYFDRKELEDWMKQNRVATRQEIEQQAINYVVTGNRK